MQQQQATLKDLINYVPEVYLSKREEEIIRATFKDNNELIKILRKILLPNALDPELPIEEFGQDIWLFDTDWKNVPVEQIKSMVQGRQESIKFVIGGLLKLKILANTPHPSEEDEKERARKDSSK